MSVRPTIIALGEILWDRLPSGPQFGGAPANFGHHAALLGARVSMVSGVGNDELGARALAIMEAGGLDVSAIAQSEAFPTGVVNVTFDDAGPPSYQFNDTDAWDHLPWTDQLARLAQGCDAVCFGTLGQRSRESRETIQRFVGSTQTSALRVLDINLRPPFFDDELIFQSLELANVLKVNDDELDHLAKLHDISGSEIECARQLARRFQLNLVAVTRGSRGGLLVCDDDISEVAAQAIDIEDTVGAGDAFTAAVVIGMLAGIDLDSINRSACRIAEYVCSQSGATPPLPSELCNLGAANGD